MSAIQNFLDYLLHARLGKDVRQSIHDAIKQCYDDATGNPESVAAVVEQNDKMKELLENTPYTTVGSEGEFELPVHTINDSETSAWSTWSSEKIIETLSGYKKNSEAVVYGDVVSKGGSSTIITLDFPDGFNVENCYIKSFMWESNNTRRIASFGGNYDDSVAGFTQTGPYLAVSGVTSGHTLRAIFILDKFPGGITIPEL